DGRTARRISKERGASAVSLARQRRSCGRHRGGAVIRVLVVEDGTEYAEFLRQFLAQDCSVRAAASAKEALAKVAEEAPQLLVIDLRFDRVPPEALVGDLDAT